ncbi:hypothetical protein RA210_U10416 [Rubrivivax sp. A210]|uniref:hypothetical protein n=1 Tax=Rubrivivax sp. A210 TaxID=2772301 RepID=UPI0019180C09|nr:hypothetical protein [Rubrivivax sp. A210]CAD5366620.1 hypothetical protein RA210_U10416 [Rubrivivax sp. A210]
MRPFTIVFSNYTFRLFAWTGTPQANRKFLGNREVLGSVVAADSDEAMRIWDHQVAAERAAKARGGGAR